MTVYSLGFHATTLLAERAAVEDHFDEILPEHLWLGLMKLTELERGAFGEFGVASEEERDLLEAEISEAEAWFSQRSIDVVEIDFRVRDLLGEGSASGAAPVRAATTVALAGATVARAESHGRVRATAMDLADALVEQPTLILATALLQAAYERLVMVHEPVRISVTDGAVSPPHGAGYAASLGRDLTGLAAQRALDRLIGRKEELLRLAQVLSRKYKSNALLVGDAGVGKTCIVEGLAQKIVSSRCPPAFRNKRIIELSISALRAGASYPGSLEERLERVIAEAEADPSLILFIDEFHTVMGWGSGGMELAHSFKPAMARGKIRLIGATTPAEYFRHIVKDEAISRRFEVVWLDEPLREEAIEVLDGAKGGLEQHHGVVITRDAIEAAVDLSIRYLPDQRLPDKALDLLDQACAQLGLECLTIDTSTWQPGGCIPGGTALSITRTDVARVLAQRVRLPLDLLALSDRERLQALEGYLGERVLGQDTAMQSVAEVLRGAYAGLKDPRRPITTFLFAGPTGVGKTETAKALAEFLFGTPQSLVHIDLSEYFDQYQIAKLIGSAPGYVGYEEGGRLTNALRRRPASVVLFDEIDKAHPLVLDVLLQILDEGRLTDGQGRPVSLREAVVILTTNIMPGRDETRPLGFGTATAATLQPGIDPVALMGELRRKLRPELLGRIRNTVLFDYLSREALADIASKAFSEVANRVRNSQVQLPEKLREEILSNVRAVTFGARDIERLVENKVGEWLKTTSEEPRPETRLIEEVSAGLEETVLLSSLPAIPLMDAALLVVDLVPSSRCVRDPGDTTFSRLMGRIYQWFHRRDAASQVLYLRSTGDGFLAVYDNVHDAVMAARWLMEGDLLADMPFRIALHWGTMRVGPDRDPLGEEVHRVLRIEGLSERERHDPEVGGASIAAPQRVLATKPAWEQMNPADRSLFRHAGAFRVKGFEEPCEMWVATREAEDKETSGAGYSHKGDRRATNDDAFLCDTANGLFVVADGMGGKRGSHTASQAVITVFPMMLRKRLRELSDPDPEIVKAVLADTLVKLSKELYERSRTIPELRGMGSTAAVVSVLDNHTYVAYAGDSRVYLLRKRKIRQMSEDQTTACVLVETGLFTWETLANHPLRHALEEYVGKEEALQPGVDAIVSVPGDRWLLCSDGLWREVPEEQLELILSMPLSPYEICRKLIDAAVRSDGSDNVTAVVVDVR